VAVGRPAGRGGKARGGRRAEFVLQVDADHPRLYGRGIRGEGNNLGPKAGQGTTRRSDGSDPDTVQEGQRQIAQGCQRLRGMAGAQPRMIPGEGHIADAVQAVINVPMVTHEPEQAGGASLRRGYGRDEMDDLLGLP
jgi:hypothetical protein